MCLEGRGTERFQAAPVARELRDRQRTTGVAQVVGWVEIRDAEPRGELADPLVQRRERHTGEQPRERQTTARRVRVQLEPVPVERELELGEQPRHRALFRDEAERADEVCVEEQRLRHLQSWPPEIMAPEREKPAFLGTGSRLNRGTCSPREMSRGSKLGLPALTTAATPATAATAATTAAAPSLSILDGDLASLDVATVQLLDGLASLFLGRHLDEAEAARA